MSDDLVKRLRVHVMRTDYLSSAAADRIEELEAKLAKAVEVASDLYRLHWRRGPAWDHPPTKQVMEDASTTLAELKGQDDE